MEILDKLWRLAEKEQPATHPGRVDILSGFDCIGLILNRPLMNAGYRSTPVNSSTFAGTGGDGVHFGLLHLFGGVTETSPVVMTVPMCFGNENMILGANLIEFLCLGCQSGYTHLEQLSYDKARGIDLILHPEKALAYPPTPPEYSPSPDEIAEVLRILDLLTNEFDLQPWNDVAERLKELQNQFLSLLVFPADDD